MKSSPHRGDNDAVQAPGAQVAPRHLRVVVPPNAAVGSGGDSGFPVQTSPDGSADDESLTVLAW